MKKMTANEIRQTWLEFFKSKGHHIEPSASLIPHNDPTLLWINAGVAALKKYFDGSEVPPCRRITNLQKCIRTNDIDHVGFTARHHTFFEMLGNFSIGDYFRNEVIPWAVEVLTDEKWFGMPKDKLYMTYFPDDIETKNLWIKCGIDPNHLIPLEGNFWEIGEGPCGPDTEIFFDRGEKYDPQGLGEKLLREDIENDRYIEIWNIVFSQFNSEIGKPRSEYKELPSKNIDTGGGLERFACVIQGTDTNFETDLFVPMIKELEKIANTPYVEKVYFAYRVIVDHIRALTFAISDGESFSNEGRGYVLRRLLRRATVYGHKLGINEPFLYKLVNTVTENYKDFYPYLTNRVEFVSKIVKAEEDKFLKTLSLGEARLYDSIKGKKVLEGAEAFKLYDTYGFPIEITKEICLEQGVDVDEDGFKVEMDAQKERARKARGELQSMKKQSKDLLDCALPSEFIYGINENTGKVIALFKDGEKVDEITEEGEVMFDKTCFYATSGGQVNDTGIISNTDTSAQVVGCEHAPNKQNLHFVKVLYGSIKVGDSFKQNIDVNKRTLTMRNHSAAHLLDQTLFDVLGDHVKQQGSFVSDEYLRFDFNHFEKINAETLNEIERIVNEKIALALPVETKVLPIEEAKKLGAKALFDEKYGDYVRVINMGDYSKEFCGGTHVSNTEQIGVFVIESEESIASGIRRIQARTSKGAYELLKRREHVLDEVKNVIRAKSNTEVVDMLKANFKQHEADLLALRKTNEKIISSLAKTYASNFVSGNNKHILIENLSGFSRENLLLFANNIKDAYEDYVIVLFGGSDKEVPIFVKLSDSAVKEGLLAGNIVKEITKHIGGSGGGRPNEANGKGLDASKINEAIKALREIIK